jgi:hypothetical protein
MSGFGGVGSSGRPAGGVVAGGGGPARLAAGSAAPAASGTYFGSSSTTVATGHHAGYSTSHGSGGSSIAAGNSADLSVAWQMEPMEQGGVRYLVDRVTGAVYLDNQGNACAWLELAGRIGAGGAIDFRKKNTAGAQLGSACTDNRRDGR